MLDRELRTLNSFELTHFLLFTLWRVIKDNLGVGEFLYMYAVLIPAITVILIPKETPQAWVIQIGWASLCVVGLMLLVRYRPRKKYHYINKKYRDE
jgi:hypothetical protein